MGDRDEIGVSTGEAREAGASAATLADLYEVVDLDFRAVIGAVTDAVVEPAVQQGVAMFCEAYVDDLVRLRAHLRAVGQGADDAAHVAAETDRANAERFARRAV